MKKKLYIETSVWNQLEHSDRPDWKETAKRFIATLKADYYEPYISAVVIDEIAKTEDEAKRRGLLSHIDSIQPVVLEFNPEAVALTEKYMAADFIRSNALRVYNDCSHVAISTVNGITHIVSFNCKHLVNDRRIDGFNAINFQNGYDHLVDICTPEKFNMIPMEDSL
jgi:predicted nucleic acid-binding protein